jgi:nucleotide-binding universal stress UspA family protein
LSAYSRCSSSIDTADARARDVMSRKILVPYDGSKPADMALDQAVNIAKAFGKDRSEVILLHVIPEFSTYHFIDRPARSIKTGEKIMLSQYLKEVYQLMEKNAKEALAKKSYDVKKFSDFEIKTRVMAGRISDAIIGFAKKEGVDIVIIGNVGRSGISKVKTLGSVSRSVSERAHCPVMIVH